MGVGKGGHGGLGPHGFWNFQLKMFFFLVLRVVEIQFHHFGTPWKNLGKIAKWPSLEKILSSPMHVVQAMFSVTYT